MTIEWPTKESIRIMFDLIRNNQEQDNLHQFILESNMIEGIIRKPKQCEINAHNKLISTKKPNLQTVIDFVEACEPTAKLRNKPGMNVRVGGRVPIYGSGFVQSLLEDMIENLIDLPTITPVEFHKKYEKLHPFMDCNGRSGRALWYWQMVNLHNRWPDRFLQEYYYQTLSV